MIPHTAAQPATAEAFQGLGFKNPVNLKKVPGLKQVKGLYRSRKASSEEVVDDTGDPDGKAACSEGAPHEEAENARLRDQDATPSSRDQDATPSGDKGSKRTWMKAAKSVAYEAIPHAKNVDDASHDLENGGSQKATSSSGQSKWKKAAASAANATVNVTVKAAKTTASATKKVAKAGKKGAKKGYDMVQSATEKPTQDVIERKGLKRIDLEIGESSLAEEPLAEEFPTQENADASNGHDCTESAGAASRLLGGVTRTFERAADAATEVKASFQEKAKDAKDAGQHRLKVAADITQQKARDAGQVAKAAKESTGRTAQGAKDSFKGKAQGASAKVAKAAGSAKGKIGQAKEMIVSRRRLARFAIAFSLGIFLLVIAFGFLPALALAPHKFALPFSFGSVLLLASSAILKGFRKFAQGTIQPKKLPFTLAYVVGLVGTLFATLVARSYVLTIVFGILQAVALAYFIATGVPGGKRALNGLGRLSRKLAGKAMRRILGTKK